MTLSIVDQPLPLRLDDRGAYRVGPSRVLLDTVIFAYQSGDDPETIARNFPTLQLADVYLVIGYYLSHREDVDAYLDRRRGEAESLQRQLEADGIAPTDVAEVMDRLRGRLKSRA